MNIKIILGKEYPNWLLWFIAIEYEISPEMISKLEALEKEAVALVEKDEKNSDEALALFNQCIELESKYPSAYNNR